MMASTVAHSSAVLAGARGAVANRRTVSARSTRVATTARRGTQPSRVIHTYSLRFLSRPHKRIAMRWGIATPKKTKHTKTHPRLDSLSPNQKAVRVVTTAMARETDPKKRIVITGMGLVSVFGNDYEKFYDKLLSGTSGVAEIDRFDITEFPTKFAAQIRDFDNEVGLALFTTLFRIITAD
jgi:hypothetical protein